ncbi:carboxypeptidase-like regulatory domain-containing protein [Terrimonas pollutisoli]|uniref:carboxypeptidase-like regulatory domain-containing protein n=1 Tax=Terrimonas pollutisoli TaxID=3034147 RepID=UPI0023EE2847|nr:carboxypeptidase-like regulatory domain-containing protein [Terrimonas sp. H1YJ31]
MANGHNILFTAADIERYHRGLMSSKERHAIEKAALDDPFLADALEGYVNTSTFNEDLSGLKQRLADRTGEKKKVIPIAVNKPSFSWWKVAAMIVLIAGAGLMVYQLAFNTQKEDIAQSPQPKDLNQQKNEPEKTILPSTSDSSSIATEFAKPADENKTGDDQASVKIKKREEVLQATPSAPRIATNSLAKDSVNPDDVAGIVAEKTIDELKSDNTQYKKSVLAKELPAGADLPVVSPSYSRQGRKVAAASQNIDVVQRRQTFNQPNVFRGRVTDMNNNALPFSNITNKEDNIGTYSDANGYFTLTSPDTVLNVQIKSIGFVSDDVRLNNKVASNQVYLQEDRNSLAEIVLSNKKVNTNRSRNDHLVLNEAEPADGWNNYDLYLANNLKTPETFKDKQEGSQGEVELSFEVGKSGEPINITVKKSLCESCDKEAIRLLKEGPKWKRKAKKGKATVTISF